MLSSFDKLMVLCPLQKYSDPPITDMGIMMCSRKARIPI